MYYVSVCELVERGEENYIRQLTLVISGKEMRREKYCSKLENYSWYHVQ